MTKKYLIEIPAGVSTPPTTEVDRVEKLVAEWLAGKRQIATLPPGWTLREFDDVDGARPMMSGSALSAEYRDDYENIRDHVLGSFGISSEQFDDWTKTERKPLPIAVREQAGHATAKTVDAEMMGKDGDFVYMDAEPWGGVLTDVAALGEALKREGVICGTPVPVPSLEPTPYQSVDNLFTHLQIIGWRPSDELRSWFNNQLAFDLKQWGIAYIRYCPWDGENPLMRLDPARMRFFSSSGGPQRFEYDCGDGTRVCVPPSQLKIVHGAARPRDADGKFVSKVQVPRELLENSVRPMWRQCNHAVLHVWLPTGEEIPLEASNSDGWRPISDDPSGIKQCVGWFRWAVKFPLEKLIWGDLLTIEVRGAGKFRARFPAVNQELGIVEFISDDGPIEPAACDCGGVTARTPCADWCATRKAVGK